MRLIIKLIAAPFIHQVKVDDEKLAELCSIGFDETNAKHVLEVIVWKRAVKIGT